MASHSAPPWPLAIAACLTLGLAPFNPPHVVEKLGMLIDGTLSRPIDIFDLLMHGAPWVYLIFLIVRMALQARDRGDRGTPD